jgi:hypothetical protein
MNSVPSKNRKHQRKMVRSLTKGEHPRDEELADKLRGCNRDGGSPCVLPMCPVCFTIIYVYIFREWLKCIGPLFWEPKLQFSSLRLAVPGESYPIGPLDEIDLPSINRRIQREYERVGFPLVFSTLDISLIADSPQKVQPFWQAGVYSLIFSSRVMTRERSRI